MCHFLPCFEEEMFGLLNPGQDASGENGTYGHPSNNVNSSADQCSIAVESRIDCGCCYMPLPQSGLRGTPWHFFKPPEFINLFMSKYINK
uniref:Uncharacterized protein n=1 Tax=Sinocyclocheilus rhinocerous TaxID=307959 RepID=A0A673MQ58_9TELE